MARETYENRISEILGSILRLGKVVSEALKQSVEQLSRRDLEGAALLIERDEEINRMRFQIEEDCLTLIATQQPVATDLRKIASVLEIATELERIGDYAKGIARLNIFIGQKPLLKPLVDIPRMCERARGMLEKAVEAFVREDAAAARAIPEQDQLIDELYKVVQRDLIFFILKDPGSIDPAMALLWVAHNLERSGDRVENICERVIFTVTGEQVDLG
ncbi:phosphate signaling complex protein PhoU [Candidatus Fermentibacterales bacterium]|nr:phosphate signaling complex protein PhoU [Candidatus Fermentibacterales bacterium]